MGIFRGKKLMEDKAVIQERIYVKLVMAGMLSLDIQEHLVLAVRMFI